MLKYSYLFLFFISISTYSQESTKNTKIDIEIGTFISDSGENPFWIRSNTYGIVPLESSGFTLRASLSNTKPLIIAGKKNVNYSDLKQFNNTVRKALTVDYGLEIVGNLGKQNQFLVPQIYGALHWKGMELYVGRKKEIRGLADTTLSAGSYILSGNALPLPKIQLSTRGFVPIVKSKFIMINAGISHGWFSDNGVVKNFYLHEKWLYGSLGKSKGKLKLYGGVNHQAQWGGYSEALKNVEGGYEYSKDGYLAPYPLYSYQYLLIPFLHRIIGINPAKVPSYDVDLAVGNQLGSVDFGGTYEFPNIRLFLYHQHPYDFSRSIKNFNNIEDGNNGLTLYFKEKKTLQALNLEFLNTTSQGRFRFGKFMGSNFNEVDNYFSHGQYKGWFYEDKIIGTPFISLSGVDGSKYLQNRVKAASATAKGEIKSLSYMARYTFTHGLGTYGRELDLKQSYMWLSIQKPINQNQRFSIQIGSDIGKIQPQNNFGVMALYGISL